MSRPIPPPPSGPRVSLPSESAPRSAGSVHRAQPSAAATASATTSSEVGESTRERFPVRQDSGSQAQAGETEVTPVAATNQPVTDAEPGHQSDPSVRWRSQRRQAQPPGAEAAGQLRSVLARLKLRLGSTTGLLTALGAVVLVVVGGVFGTRYLREGPSAEVINAYLDSVVPAGKLRVKTVEQGVRATHDGQMYVTFTAKLETTEALYTPVDAAAYIRDELHLDLAPFARAEAALASPAGARLREKVGAAPADPAAVTLLKLSTPAGTEVPYSGTVLAHRGKKGWALDVKAGPVPTQALVGQPRPPAPARTYVAGDAADMAELKALAAARLLYAARVIEAQASDTAQRKQQLSDALVNGSMYGARITRADDLEFPLWLEITAVNRTTREVTAQLREGGAAGRPLEGIYEVADEALNLTLTSRDEDLITGGGSFLGMPGELTLRAALKGDTLSGRLTGGWKCEWKRLSADEVARYWRSAAGRAEHRTSNTEHRTSKAETAATSGRKAPPTVADKAVPSAGRHQPRPTAEEVPSERDARAPSGDASSVAQTVPDTAPPSAQTGATAGANAVAPSGTANGADDGYPKVTGAYVKVNGGWQKLPHNTPVLTRQTGQVLSNLGGWIGAVTGKRIELPDGVSLERLGQVSFGSTQAVPVVDGKDVTLVYVGMLGTVPAEYTAQHPELRDFPVITMAVLRADSSGARKAALYRLVPGLLAFREGRLPGNFVRVNERVAQLTVSGTVAAGRYAIAAGEEVFEVEVR